MCQMPVPLYLNTSNLFLLIITIVVVIIFVIFEAALQEESE